MKVVFCSAEVFPFSKTGGLADVSNSIPKEISKLGHDVVIITPLYKFINLEDYSIELKNEHLYTFIGDFRETFALYESILPDSDVRVYFVRHPYLYRDGIYTDNDDEEYPDNAMRFLFFSKVIFAVLEYLSFSPDIIHVNDWHTGLVPFFHKTEFIKKYYFKDTKTVFTIHNIGYQGSYAFDKISRADIPDKYFTEDFIVHYDLANFMKTGIVFADIVTTVSQQYSIEIGTKEYGHGLEGSIQKRKNDLYGIVHGIDYSQWDPKTDPYIETNYDHTELKGKKECKRALQQELGLEQTDKPLLGIVSRLAYQKGLDLVLEKFDEILGLGVQLVLLGTGDKQLEKQFKEKQKEYPHNCSINITFNNELAHKIEAGVDLFLMPSRYEPCGLNQMYSMIYGTIPIVRKTGGLADTVQEYNLKKQTGNGFIFENYDPDEFLDAIKRAVQLYKNRPKLWKSLVKKVMQIDFAWKKVAKEWERIYKKVHSLCNM